VKGKSFALLMVHLSPVTKSYCGGCEAVAESGENIATYLDCYFHIGLCCEPLKAV